MPALAQAIHDAAAARIPAAPVTDPTQLLTGPGLLGIFATVEDAVAALENIVRGNRIFTADSLNGGPPSQPGLEGDLLLDLATYDLWSYRDGQWLFLFNMAGNRLSDGPGPPSNSVGTVGSYYFQHNVAVWRKEASGWVQRFTLSGGGGGGTVGRTITAVLPVAVNSGSFTIGVREAGTYTAWELAGATDYTLTRGGVTLAKPTASAPLSFAAGDALTLTLTNHTANVQAVVTLKP